MISGMEIAFVVDAVVLIGAGLALGWWIGRRRALNEFRIVHGLHVPKAWKHARMASAAELLLRDENAYARAREQLTSSYVERARAREAQQRDEQ